MNLTLRSTCSPVISSWLQHLFCIGTRYTSWEWQKDLIIFVSVKKRSYSSHWTSLITSTAGQWILARCSPKLKYQEQITATMIPTEKFTIKTGLDSHWSENSWPTTKWIYHLNSTSTNSRLLRSTRRGMLKRDFLSSINTTHLRNYIYTWTTILIRWLNFWSTSKASRKSLWTCSRCQTRFKVNGISSKPLITATTSIRRLCSLTRSTWPPLSQ